MGAVENVGGVGDMLGDTVGEETTGDTDGETLGEAVGDCEDGLVVGSEVDGDKVGEMVGMKVGHTLNFDRRKLIIAVELRLENSVSNLASAIPTKKSSSTIPISRTTRVTFCICLIRMAESRAFCLSVGDV